MKETKHGDIILVSDERLEHPVGRIQSRPLGPGEISDPERRRMASEGLALLWKAMQLHEGERSSRETYDLYASLYRHVGIILLGNDYPEFEVWT